MAGPREVDLAHLGLDRPRVHPLLPVGVVAVDDLQRDRPAHRAAVADARADLGGVLLDLHPPAAAVAELAPRHVGVEDVAVELEAGGQPLDDRRQSGTVRLAGRGEAQRAHAVTRPGRAGRRRRGRSRGGRPGRRAPDRGAGRPPRTRGRRSRWACRPGGRSPCPSRGRRSRARSVGGSSVAMAAARVPWSRAGARIGPRRGAGRGARGRGGRPSAERGAALPASSRRTTRGTSASTTGPWRPTPTRIIAAIGADEPLHPDFGTRSYGIPYTTVGGGQPARAGVLRLRRRVRPRPVPDPARRADRGRRATATRSSSTATRCKLYELFAAQRRERRRALARRARARSGPALEPAAARGLDVGRRGRAADPARPRALRRGAARRRSTTRCASPSRARATRSSTPRATSPRR